MTEERKPVQFSRAIGSKSSGTRSLNTMLLGKDVAFVDLDSQSSNRKKVSTEEELKEAFRKPGKRN
ncbi:hypothetical protein HCA69_16025 [Listeria grandensis]|uniref:Uncharacterized protein n=1 Tax=Listeria grandensis TaxID=1494963 RepID=A0A7X1CRA4_9LIST|nr:hypothetical protein [Listeria grandensis]MBC1937871.1 hypothetical protein [Listeria grandensis]